jgi:Methyltransferase domain
MKENEIRPKAIFEEYLRLTEADVETFFSTAARHAVPCPACGGTGSDAFTKSGFSYALCPDCDTLFVTPRPDRAAFDAYYRDAPSTRFWATVFYKATEAARREKIWKPKVRLVAEKIDTFGGGRHVVDIGGGYGTFAEELLALPGFSVTVVEPSVHLARVCREKGLPVVERFLEELTPGDLAAGPKTYVSFELFEHLHEPVLFLEVLARLMGPEDMFVFTTLSGTGLDIQVLWEKSQSVAPPHHLNFINPESAHRLLNRCGMDVLEVTTPGQLDIDILQNNIADVTDRFWRAFLQRSDEAAKARMQRYLAENLLSSHMMVVARRQS